MGAPRGVFAVFAPALAVTAMTAAALSPGPAAAAAWPLSDGLVIAEVVTGGASASDEYIEIANAGTTDVDLGGCELVYATASGVTVTRKASFGESLPLAPGGHLLVANSAGIYGTLADVTYSGGLAADGGSLAVRRAGGEVIDAVGWGTAANQFVEGSAAPAPPSSSSIERRPGGRDGNTADSNDNSSDFVVQPDPIPQSLAPVPATSPTPEPTAATTPDGARNDGDGHGRRERGADGHSRVHGSPATTRRSTAAASATPGASDTSGATIAPTPVLTAAPSAEVPLMSIADARIEAPGARVHVRGIVTAELGRAGNPDLFVIEDSAGAIFVRPSGSAPAQVAIGDEADVIGSLSAPYGQLEIRETIGLTVAPGPEDPSPARLELDGVGEESEARLVSIRGSVESVTLSDGRLTIVIGDGVSSVRAMADPATGIVRGDVARGDVVVAIGIVGQHATATGRLDGYRIWLRGRSDLAVRAPIPTDPPVTRTQAAPTAVPPATDLASALGTRGRRVDVEATVTATAGLLDIDGPTIVIDDGTAAVAVIIPASAAAPGVGMRVHVAGKIGSWHGGPTVNATSVIAEGDLQSTEPEQVGGALDASLEWRLVRAYGRIQEVMHVGTRVRLEVLVGGRTLVVLGEPAANIVAATSDAGRLLMVTGIVRRSTSDSSVFQLLPRSPSDFRMGPAVSRSATGSALPVSPNLGGVSGSAPSSAGGYAGSGSGVIDIADVSSRLGETVTVAGLVTGTADGTATLNDGTGEIRVGGVEAASAIGLLEPGDAVEVTGVVAQDDAGPLLVVDPASIVAVPAGGAPSALVPAIPLDLVAGAHAASPAATPAGVGVQRLASSRAPSPDPMILLVIGCLVLLLVAGGLSAAALARGPVGRRVPARFRIHPTSLRDAVRARRRPRCP